MTRICGTVSRGLRAPIIKEGDDLAQVVIDTVLQAKENGELTIKDHDILAVTESILARSQGNYCSIDDIANDVANNLGSDHIGVIFPIFSRNRFAICLRGIARGVKKITLQLSYPSDEVGNHLFLENKLEELNISPYVDVFTEEEFSKTFGKTTHPFTGMDYVAYFKEIIEKEDCEAEIIFSNQATTILQYTKNVINCDIHTRTFTKEKLLKSGANVVCSLSDLMTQSVNGSGYNEEYGLLGSNKSSENVVKLFPRNSQQFVEDLQQSFYQATNHHIEVMIYGDGAFKDPVGKIWELADPVVSPGYTKGLEGTPNELKLKYLADNQFKDLSGDALQSAIKESIQHKDSELKGQMVSEGTTPRQLTDLIGSLCDLTSGSGDKGTPFVYISGYFDNYTDE